MATRQLVRFHRCGQRHRIASTSRSTCGALLVVRQTESSPSRDGLSHRRNLLSHCKTAVYGVENRPTSNGLIATEGKCPVNQSGVISFSRRKHSCQIRLKVALIADVRLGCHIASNVEITSRRHGAPNKYS